MDLEEELFYTKLGARIASRRNIFGITQEKLGELLGLSRVSIVNIEKGKQKPSIYQLSRVADKFNVSIDAFVSNLINEVEHPTSDKILGLEIDERSIIQLSNFLNKLKE